MLDDLKTAVEIAGGVATTLAVIVAGWWAYYKFVKGRTFRPRLEVAMSARWREVDGRHLLHTRVVVRNIGGSQLVLMQRGTGLRASLPAGGQEPPPSALAWQVRRVFEIFTDHDWIEPSEAISDDLLLDLDAPAPLPVRLETRLVWRWSRRGSDDIVVFARQVMPVGSILEGSSEIDPAPPTEVAP